MNSNRIKLGLLLKILLISLVVLIPFSVNLLYKFPTGSDFVFHSMNLKLFSKQLWGGEIYPRWLMDSNAGFGSPVFLFYPPLAFYIGSFFEIFSEIDKYGYARNFTVILLSLFISGISSYSWLAKKMPEKQAEIGAFLYITFPCFMFAVYQNSSISQLLAIAFFPIILIAAEAIITKGWRAIPNLALAYFLISITSIPNTIIFSWIPCIYVIYFARREQKTKSFIFVIISGLLGVIVASFYLLPLLLNKQYITSEVFTNDKSKIYSNNFYMMGDAISAIMVVFPLLLLFYELPKQIKNKIPSDICFWIFILYIMFFMVCELSKPFWDNIFFLQFLQFPNRFFVISTPAVVLIIAYYLPYIKSPKAYFYFSAIVIICLNIIYTQLHFSSSEDVTKRIQQYNLVVSPEYRTKLMDKEGIESTLSFPDELIKMPQTKIIEGSGEVSLLSEKPRSITLHANIKSDTALVSLRRFYFTGWQVDSGASIQEYHSLLAVQLPKGEHDIKLELKWFEGEYEGLLVSCFGLFILLVITAFAYIFPMNKNLIKKSII